ncbi:MAG: peptidoglycan lytic exotransglycosylase [Burkholderia sp.]|jgi:membrane-bound lytic murein transglycosylase A
MLKKLTRWIGAAAAVLTLAACTSVEPPSPSSQAQSTGAVFQKSSFAELPAADPGSWERALSAFRRSCGAMGSQPRWQNVCRAALATDAIGAQRFFMSSFTPWKVTAVSPSGTSDTGLMTGYYEPQLRGSRVKRSPYVWPIYRVPDDLLIVDLSSVYPKLRGMRLRGKLEGRRVIPYDSRAEIQRRKDMDRYAIAWVDDPIEAFFLQIQGSGRIVMPDGSVMRVGFADQNGHSYKAIGNWLVSRGYLRPHEVSMQRIIEWARRNPSKVNECLAQNPSYVFFEERPAAPGLGPNGAQNVPLTPMASAAVDLRYWRLGTPFVVSVSQSRPALAFTRPIVAQDTGGAIRGPIRFDYFWGYGDRAGELAGRQKSAARAWVLVPNGLTPDDIRARR